MRAHSEFITRLRAVPASAAALRAERKRISREVAVLDRTALLGMAHELIEALIARFVAYELVLNHQPAMESITQQEVEKLGEGMRHWGDVDAFSCIVAGPAWRAGRIRDTVIRAWARSDDWCWRRAALVSTVPLNSRAQGGAGDPKRTLSICGMLIADRHDLVVKAMSWALRELAKRDPKNVRLFLSRHRNELAVRVVREVNNKLTTGLKNPRE
ncbi:MAG TPA: DNA alkylation repair protein [Candidatus Acidoferrales bacterium]|jgi:3-methyladenine DNA glycosylase AlkD|nr:DNA alkylation repair protein [Candidatus Acidoferrales bacterium]